MSLKSSICRMCLTSINPKEAISVDDNCKCFISDNIVLKDIIGKCMPEMDLDICYNAAVCKTCKDSLINIYVFKLKCCQTEEKIYTYIEQSNMKLGDKICLENLIKADEEVDTILISDSDSNTSEPVRVTYNESDSDFDDHDAPANITQKNAKKRYTRRRGPFICGVCDRMLSDTQSIRLHILYKHSVLIEEHGYAYEETPGPSENTKPPKTNEVSFTSYKCGMDSCDATFISKSAFNSHIVKHVHYRPFICPLCNRGYLDYTQWNVHMKITHPFD